MGINDKDYGAEEKFIVINSNPDLVKAMDILKKAWDKKIRDMHNADKKQAEYKKKIFKKYGYDILPPSMDLDDWKVNLSFFAYLFGLTGAKIRRDDHGNQCVNEDSIQILIDRAKDFQEGQL